MATHDLSVDGHVVRLVLVEGTRGRPYTFGDEPETIQVEIPDFFLSQCTVTVELWTQLMGDCPSIKRGPKHPVENISWDEIMRPDGFLDRMNSRIGSSTDLPRTGRFRLPSETEWEYAARGGPYWSQRLRFSGSNAIDDVAWYQNNSGDTMHDVGLKAANQLGLHDMSGNTWEWCHDTYHPDVRAIPTNGSPYNGEGTERVLRGGCFHNWAIHCTVSKRYQIDSNYHDGCIGFRLVYG